MSIKDSLPKRRPVTLTRLKGFRERLQNISPRQQLLSPQLFPVQAGMKIAFAKKKTAEHPNQSLESVRQVSFEPPDPFAK